MIVPDFSGVAKRLGLRREQMALVVGFGIAQALFEAGAVMIMLPVLQYIQAGGDVAQLSGRHQYWHYVTQGFALIGAPVTLAGLLAIAFLSVLVRQLMQFWQRVLTARVRSGLVARIRLKLFESFLAADLATVERDASGRMFAEFTSEAETATTALFYSLQIVILVGIFGVYFGGLLILSWQLTLLSMAILAGTAFLLKGLLSRSRGIGEAVSGSNQEVGAFLVERLRALRLIRLSRTEVPERSLAQTLLLRQRRNQLEGERLVALLATLVEPIFIGFAFFCLWFGASRLGLGLSTLGVFLVIVLRLVPIGKDLMGARQVILQTSASLDVVDASLNRLRSAREPDEGKHVLVQLNTGIRLEDVAFAYADGREALERVDLLIRAREMTALVGPSGGGKSTLVDLLPRLRRPSKGRVLLDNMPIDDIELSSLRAGIAFVPQQAQLFDGTIADHIRYGRSDASQSDVEQAARLAHAHDFITSLPEGYATRIGEGGGRLSGGQRQRLDLARALIQKAPVLILDEPTSALDSESEQAFRVALDDVRKQLAPTAIVIAHRLSTVVNADRIVVIDQGRVLETGTHAELLARGGWYARAWTAQTAHAA